MSQPEHNFLYYKLRTGLVVLTTFLVYGGLEYPVISQTFPTNSPLYLYSAPFFLATYFIIDIIFWAVGFR